MGVAFALAAEDGMNGGDVAFLYRFGTRLSVSIRLDHRRQNPQQDSCHDAPRDRRNRNESISLPKESRDAGRPALVMQCDLGPDTALEIVKVANSAIGAKPVFRLLQMVFKRVFSHLFNGLNCFGNDCHCRVQCQPLLFPPDFFQNFFGGKLFYRH